MTYVHYKNSADNSWAVRNKAVFIPIPCGVETRKLRLTIRNASHGCIGFRMNRCASRSDWLWSSVLWDLPRNSRGRRPTHTVVYLLAKRPAKAIRGEWSTTGREQRQSSSSGGSILGSGGVERAGIGAEEAASHEPITYISV